jgi:hypothetical protein
MHAHAATPADAVPECRCRCCCCCCRRRSGPAPHTAQIALTWGLLASACCIFFPVVESGKHILNIMQHLVRCQTMESREEAVLDTVKEVMPPKVRSARVRACVLAYVRACVRARVRACVRACALFECVCGAMCMLCTSSI